MSRRRIIGAALLALPFVVLFTVIGFVNGPLLALSIAGGLGGLVAVVAVMSYGVWLLVMRP